MKDNNKHDNFIYIHPGELYIARDKKPVITILGSCISLVMYNRPTGTGGIFHAMFPENRQDNNANQTTANVFGKNSKYTDYAFYRLLEHFKAMGIDPKKTELKLFGGSSSFTDKAGMTNFCAGRLNISMVKQLLDKEGLRLQAENTGGTKGRKLVFIPMTGDVYIKFL